MSIVDTHVRMVQKLHADANRSKARFARGDPCVTTPRCARRVQTHPDHEQCLPIDLRGSPRSLSLSLGHKRAIRPLDDGMEPAADARKPWTPRRTTVVSTPTSCLSRS